MKNSRRLFLKTFGTLSAALALPARTVFADDKEDQSRQIPPPAKSGYLSIIQGPTSATETLINIMAPRLKKYAYQVTDENGAAVSVAKYETVLGPHFYNVDKLRVSGLRVGVRYTLKVIDRSKVVDERTFRALNTANHEPRFAILSCMADDNSFNDVIDPMWEKLRQQQPEFLILSGDQVYVDSFEFVERQKATELDIWQRYVDALKRLPLYHWRDLIPVFAVWDDHDFGTNDGDRNFVSKEQALRLFRAVYLGPELPGTWAPGPHGASSCLTAFGQRFCLMDDRMFRQPNINQQSQEEFGHWGREQHEWVVGQLQQTPLPTYLVNGNQFFNGTNLDFKEAFEKNHPAEFVRFTNQLKKLSAPVVFVSGDVHLSEIMQIPADRVGHQTYEITSSSMHSFTGDGWENPMRISGAYTTQHNFVIIHSKVRTKGLALRVESHGLAAQPYFVNDLVVSV